MTKPMDEPQNGQAHEPESNQPNQGQWFDELTSLDFRTGRCTKSSIAQQVGKSEAAVRKAVKAIQQVIPLDALEVDKLVTELGEFLVIQFFTRQSDQSAAQWIEKLRDFVGALPSPNIWQSSGNEVFDYSVAAKNKTLESSALAIKNHDDLNSFFGEFASVQDAKAQDEEAEIDLIYQQAYQREIERQKVIFKAQLKAKADFDRKAQAMGL